MKLIKRLFYVPKYEKTENIDDSLLTKSIIISIISVLLCVICLFGLSWAWFTASEVNSSNKIVSADFNVTVTVTGDGLITNLSSSDSEYVYDIDSGKSYQFVFTKTGSAQSVFCHITVYRDNDTAGTSFYTDKLVTGTDYTISVSGFKKIKITPTWVEPLEAATKVLNGGAIAYNP